MALKRDLNDMKNSMSELATMSRTTPTIANELKSSPSALSQLQMRLRSSLENIVDGDDVDEPLVTFPDETPTGDLELELHAPRLPCVTPGELSITNDHLNSTDTVKFEEKRMVSASKTKVIKDGFSSEQVSWRHLLSLKSLSTYYNLGFFSFFCRRPAIQVK